MQMQAEAEEKKKRMAENKRKREERAEEAKRFVCFPGNEVVVNQMLAYMITPTLDSPGAALRTALPP